MRKKNSKPEFSSERNELLLKHFRESLARQSVISAQRAFGDAANAPAPRFWVSEARAVRVINSMLKGENPTEDMYPEKREMYLEIYRRVLKMRKENPEMPIGDIVFTVVNNPAPKSYISWQRARQLVESAKCRVTSNPNH